MARRQCDDCGAHMGPYEPRTRVGDQMLCDACKASPGGGMVSARVARGLPKTQKCEYCDDQATKRLLWAEGMAYIPTCEKHETDGRHQIEVTNKDEVVGVKPIEKASARKVAHDSGDGMTVFHCPFCGSGQVLARSDRTIECQFCHTAFTVQVQPVYPNFPQTIDGQPMQVPGMPGQVGGPPPGSPLEGMDTDPAEPGAAPPFGQDDVGDDGDVPPTDEADADADADSGSGDSSGHEKETGNPFAKKKSRLYRASNGTMISEDDFVHHIAIVTSSDPAATARAIKTSLLNEQARQCPGCGNPLHASDSSCSDCGKDVSGITSKDYDCATCGGSGYASKDPTGQRTFDCPCCGATGKHDAGDDCYDLDTFEGGI